MKQATRGSWLLIQRDDGSIHIEVPNGRKKAFLRAIAKEIGVAVPPTINTRTLGRRIIDALLRLKALARAED